MGMGMGMGVNNPPMMAPNPQTITSAPKPSAPLIMDAQQAMSNLLDDSHRDRFGFSADELSLTEAFTLKNLKFREQLPETQFHNVVTQNNRMWIYTQRSNYLIKCEVDQSGSVKSGIRVLDDQTIRQKRLFFKKMFVD